MNAGNDDERHNNYGMNSRIMITAIISLSCVVFIVTLLHIYARFVFRRHARRQDALRRLGFFTSPAIVIHPNTETPKPGLDPSVIAALPASVFKKTGEIECSVCLNVLEDGDSVRILPNCNHNFHLDCIDRWLCSNSTCPICRTEAKPMLVAEPREGVAVPPLEGTQCNAKVGGDESSSRLSSFRRILSRERSSRRIQTQSRSGQVNGLPDLERQ